MKWSEAAAMAEAAGFSRAEFCRRCGLSESAMSKGLRRGSKMSAAVRRTAQRVLAEMQREQAA